MQLWQPTRGILQPNQHWVRGQEVAAGVGTTWNPADKQAGLTLSGGNLIGTCTTAGTAQGRSVASRAYGSGKFYCEFTIVTRLNPGGAEDFGIGIASLGSHVFASNYLGQNGNGISIWPRGGSGGLNAYWTGATTQLGNMLGGSVGTVYAMAADLNTGPTLWWKNVLGGSGSGWNGSGTADPATGAGGFAPGLGGAPWCIACQLDILNDAVALNAGSSAYVGTVPSGFVNW